MFEKKMIIIFLGILITLPTSISFSMINDDPKFFGESFDETGEVIWIYDPFLFIKHIKTADVNNDGVEDVIAGEYDSDNYDDPSKVYCVNGLNGNTIWTYNLNDGVRSMTIGDINNDGVADVIAGAGKGPSTPDGRVHAIDGTDGSSIWIYTPGATGDTIGDVAIGDLDGDQYLDVAVGCWDDYVYAINGSNGATLWSREIGSIFINAVDTGDVNSDGIDDVAFAHSYLTGYDNYQGVLDGTDGSIIWNQTVSYSVENVIISDIDNDNDLEAIFGVYTDADTTEVHVRDGLTGSLEWSFYHGSAPGLHPDVFLFTYDIDQDSDQDLIVGNEYVSNYIYAFEGNSNTPMWTSELLNGYPRDLAFGDVNGNGYINIIAATYDRVQVLNATNGLKDWYYPVSGTIRGAGCADFDDDGIKDVACSGGADFSGDDPAKGIWALRTTEETTLLWEFDVEQYGNALTIVDLNDDNKEDVIAVTSNDKAWAIDGATGDELWNWTGTGNLYSVTSGDFDGNGQIDVAVAGYDQKVTALNGNDGSQIWEFNTPSSQIPRKCLQATDLNDDNKIDVIAGSDDDKIYAINGNTGAELWSYSCGGDVEEIELAQMDDYGPLDVVAAVGWSGNKAVIINGTDGTLLWDYSDSTEYAKHVETLDINDDNILDLVIGVPKMGATPGKIIMVDGITHDDIWTVTTPVGYEYSLSHGDITGDGKQDVIVGGSFDSKTVYAYDGTDGDLLWSFITPDEINCVMCYDVDNSGNIEIIVGGADQNIYVLDGNGNEIWSYPGVDEIIHVQVGDISGNGNPNIAAVTFGFDGVVYAFTTLVGSFPLQANANGPYSGMINNPIQFYGSASGGISPYTYIWNFGDGNSSTEQNPVHTYTVSDTYVISLTVTDSTANTSMDTTYVTVAPELSANANGPYSGLANELIQFTGSANGGIPPYSYHWDFGDGGASTQQNPKHYYSTPGIYNVILNVTDSLETPNEANDSTTATISSQPLEADANGPYEGIEGVSVQFIGSASGGTMPYSWYWNFGDGHTSNEKNPEHTYSTADVYTVTFTVTDNEDENDVDITTATIYSAGAVLADANGPYEGLVGEAIQFTGSASGGTVPYSWYWDFGDGGSSTVQNPTHVYAIEGSFTVILTVEDDNGQTDTDQTSATVTEDIILPTIEITKPEKGIYLNNNRILPFFIIIILKDIDVEVLASDEGSGISHVEFYVNDELKDTISVDPYTWIWDEFAFGRRTIKAVAFDNAGNSAYDEIKVWKFL
jgi:PKD repeat protein